MQNLWLNKQESTLLLALCKALPFLTEIVLNLMEMLLLDVMVDNCLS